MDALVTLDSMAQEDLASYLQQCRTGQTFGSFVYNKLPNQVVSWIDGFEQDYQRDFILLGTLPVIGSLLFNTTFVYRNGKVYYPNWNSIIVAGPGSNKSLMAYGEQLMEDLGNDVLFKAPGDTSAAGMMKFFGKTVGVGCFLETEIDSISKGFEQKWGDYSDLLRKGWENETISKYRASDEMPLVVSNPRFSVALSGTPDQVSSLISGHENGLFSRFFIYEYRASTGWKDWSSSNSMIDTYDGLKANLKELGLNLYESQINYEFKAEFDEHCVCLTNTAGNVLWGKYEYDQGLSASVYRAVVMAMKIAIGLSFVRFIDSMSADEPLEVSSEDLVAALAMVGVSMANAKGYIEVSREAKLKPDRRNFFRSLPRGRNFTTSEAIAIGAENHLKERTVYDHLNFLLGEKMIVKLVKGVYRVVTD